MQHRQGPAARSWTSVPPGKGGKGVGGGPPVEKSNGCYEYAAEQPVYEMTHPGTLSESEHENAHAMSNVQSEIPAYEYARDGRHTSEASTRDESREHKRDDVNVHTSDDA